MQQIVVKVKSEREKERDREKSETEGERDRGERNAATEACFAYYAKHSRSRQGESLTHSD